MRTPKLDGRGGGAKPPRGSNVACGGRPEDEPERLAVGDVRWVAILSCGHSAGSRGKVAAGSIPAVGATLLCRKCEPAADVKVEDVVDSRPESDEG